MTGMTRAHEILANCRRAVPNDGVLLLVEWSLAEGNAPCFAKQAAIAMMLLTGGRELTIAHYGKLLAGSGFTELRDCDTGRAGDPGVDSSLGGEAATK